MGRYRIAWQPAQPFAIKSMAPLGPIDVPSETHAQLTADELCYAKVLIRDS